MNVTFDFWNSEDAEDCHIMFAAFGWAHTLTNDLSRAHARIEARYVPDTFGAMAGEAGVFAPVQITVK